MRTSLCLVLGVFIPIQFFAAEITWNLNATYGVTQSGLANIISDARTHFLSHPDDTIIVTIDEGTYNIGGNGSHGINLSEWNNRYHSFFKTIKNGIRI